MTDLAIGFIIGWIFCSLSIARNREDYTQKIVMLKHEIYNLTKGATK